LVLVPGDRSQTNWSIYEDGVGETIWDLLGEWLVVSGEQECNAFMHCQLIVNC
jgi:hypothetical protein